MAPKHTNKTVNVYDVTENPEYKAAMDELMNTLVPAGSDLVEDQINFPPYWKPEAATGWKGKPLYMDSREQKFPRWVVESSIAMDCRVGEVRDGEIVSIQPGDRFSMGVYAGLPLERYIGAEVTVICVKDRPLKPDEETGDPRAMWIFRSFVSKEVKAMLKGRSEQDLKRLQEAHAYARQEMFKELAKANQPRSRGPIAV